MFRGFPVSLSLVLLLAACHSTPQKGRYISETDTSFSKDVRDISAKINKDPNNAELYYRRGNTFYYQDLFKDAVLDFEFAVSLDSQNALYHQMCAEAMLQSDTADSRKAKFHLEKALSIKPDFADAAFALGKLYLARQEYEKSELVFKKLTGKLDFADKAFLYLGIGKKEQKDTQQALAYFEKAQQSNPQNEEVAMQIALIKAESNDPLALQYIDKVIAINEYSDEAFYAKGLYLQSKGQYKDAFQNYEKARTLNPGHILATYNTAVLYNLFEEYAKAEEMCNKTLDLAPEYANALALRGFTFEKRGNKAAAEKDYRKALQIEPDNAMARMGLKALGLK